MKRIIFTVTNDLTYDQRMIRICSSLAGAGYEVLLVGRKKKNSIPLKDQPFKQKRLFCYAQKGKLFYVEYNIRLFFFLLFSRAKILCAIDLDTILPCFGVAKIKDIPLVYDAHEYFTEVPEVVDRFWVKKIWSWVAELTIPNLRYAYTVGEGLAKIFSKKYKIPFEVIRNVPFAQTERKEKLVSHKKVILYQGVLNEGRGLEQAIEVMQYLEGAELWLAGEGDLSEELRALTDEFNLNHKVHFLGYIRPEELRKITPQAYIGLNLLENKGLSYYFSLANKAFDYIQAEVPSIQMSFPEYVALNEAHDIFVLVDDLTIASLRQAMQQLLSNANLHARLKENCYTAAQELTWEKEAQKLIAFYKRII